MLEPSGQHLEVLKSFLHMEYGCHGNDLEILQMSLIRKNDLLIKIKGGLDISCTLDKDI